MKLKEFILPVVLSGLVGFLIYHPVLESEFLNWDDQYYVVYNKFIRLLDFASVRHFFTSFIMGNYAPVQMLTYALDYSIWELDPKGYHLTNLILHMINTAGVYFLIKAITREARIAWITAALFAVHPVNVETVAWVAQRKTLVAQLFFILSFLLYLLYVSRESWEDYVLSLVCFIISLLSKVSTVMLPALLLLFDHCYGRGITRRQLVEKLPYFAVSGIFSAIAVWSQHRFYAGRFLLHGGSVFTNVLAPLLALRRYLEVLVAPFQLSGYYYFSFKSGLTLAVMVSIAVLGAVSAVIWVHRNNRPLLFGALWFVLALIPNLQIVPLDAVMADRYLYLAAIGIYLMAGHCFAKSEDALRGRVALQSALRAGTAVVLIAFALLAWRQTAMWKDDFSLWSTTAERVPSPLAYNKLAAEYFNQERWAEVEKYVLKALEMEPDSALLITNLKQINAKKRDSATAETRFEKATFAGGCFWCMEPPFEELPGVKEVISGYAGGKQQNPTYNEVSSGNTGHAEAVEVTYDPTKLTYEQILAVFWKQIDPTDAGGQFGDRGPQYRTAIFYHSNEQKALAERSKEILGKSGRFDKPIVTEIRPVGTFYKAEEYHQDFYKKNPVRYKFYRFKSGRNQLLTKVWGDVEKSPTPSRPGPGSGLNRLLKN